MFDNKSNPQVNHVLIVPSLDSKATPTPITYQDFVRFTGDPYGTVEVPVAVIGIDAASRWEEIKKLFGRWAESGREDEDLEDLYRSRLVPSSGPEEEE